jgi:hypothetical protein
LGGELGSGIVGCGTGRALRLPYVEVSETASATDRARRLGACMLLELCNRGAGLLALFLTNVAVFAALLFLTLEHATNR